MYEHRARRALIASALALIVLGMMGSLTFAEDNRDDSQTEGSESVPIEENDGGSTESEDSTDWAGLPDDEGFPPAGPDFEVVECPPLFGEALEESSDSSDQEEGFSDFFGMFLQCGFLTVPADRDDPEKGDIRLHVTRFNSTFSDEIEGGPVVLLGGGPGESLVEQMVAGTGVFLPLLFPSDVVVVEQRGVGYSEPAPDCPEVDEVEIAALEGDPTNEELTDQAIAAISVCRDRLETEGIGTSIFSTEESAADLEALRQSLGYDQWNLYAVSYGTRVALTAMRDFPDGIRSVVLDAPYPLEANSYTATPANADRAFSKLFEACADDSACDESYPDLQNKFDQVVDRLNQTPVSIEVRDPSTGEVFEATIDGADFMDFMFESMYSTGLIPLLPAIIVQAEAGDFDPISALAGYVVGADQFINLPMYLSVECREDVAFTTSEEIANAVAEYPYLKPLFDSSVLWGESIVGVCDVWGAGEADESWKQPVTSDIPTLIFSGEFDPITPPSWAKQVHQNLSNSFLLTFPNVGHSSLLAEPCSLDLTFYFLEDPSRRPDSYCLDELSGPSFEQPLGEINMVPFTNEFDGFSGVAPEGWIEVVTGVWTRSEAGLVVLSQMSAPGVTAEEALSNISSLLGMESPPEPSGTCCGGEIQWDLYEIQIAGLLANLAVAEVDGTVYLISLEGIAISWEQLRDEVFLTAVEAFAVVEDTPVGDINMVPYTNEESEYTSVVPDGWIEIFPGFHSPNQTYNVWLSQDAVPASTAEEWIERVKEENSFAPNVTITHNGACCGGMLEWDVYEVEYVDARTALAVAESNGVVYEIAISLSGDSIEWERLYNEVFIPALKVFSPSSGSQSQYDIHIWWPNDDTTVSGTAPIHAILDEHCIYDYDMYWRADGAELVPMWNKTNHKTPHKKAYIDYSQWDWSSDDLYDIEVIAFDKQGSEIGHSMVTIHHPSN